MTEQATEPKLSLFSVGLLKIVYNVADAPVTFRIPPRKSMDLEIDPRCIEIALRMRETGGGWEVLWAIVGGPWKTNQGDFSETSSIVHFHDPIGPGAETTPKWVRDACVSALDNVNGRSVKEG